MSCVRRGSRFYDGISSRGPRIILCIPIANHECFSNLSKCLFVVVQRAGMEAQVCGNIVNRQIRYRKYISADERNKQALQSHRLHQGLRVLSVFENRSRSEEEQTDTDPRTKQCLETKSRCIIRE